MPQTLVTAASLPDEIATELGKTGIEVELESADYTKALKDAVRLLNRNRPRRNRKALTVSTETKKYELTAALHPGLQGVVDVQFVDVVTPDASTVEGLLGNQEALEQMGETLVLGGSLAGQRDQVPYGEYEQTLGYIEEAQRRVNTDPAWHAQWENVSGTAKYYLYIDIRSSKYCMYEYAWHVTPDDNATTGLRWLDESDVDWLTKYMVAVLKQRLGRILNKFGGVPNPEGGTDQTDGQDLIQQGREDEEKLMEAIQRRRRPLPPIIA
jgi:hypothetical protein